MFTVLLCLFYRLETISAEVSPDISVLGLKCPDYFGISTEVSLDTSASVSLDTSTLIQKWFVTEVSGNHHASIHQLLDIPIVVRLFTP